MREKLRVGVYCKGKLGPHLILSEVNLKQGNCRECCRAGGRLYWERNKVNIGKRRKAEEIRAPKRKLADAQYNRAHKAELSIRNKQHIENNMSKHLLTLAQKRSVKYGVPFDLTQEDIFIPKVCPALGMELKRGVGGSADSSPTLDRHIPKLGYVKGNVAVISSLANRIKTNATTEQVEAVLNWMKNWPGSQGHGQ